MLKRYKEKRSFNITTEPRAKQSKGSSGMPIFVVQKHDARRLHYDFRLEHEGALLSWAVPKGPSLNPSDKRLAIQVEDHPFDYRDFEGTIPQGQYGAGTVMVWDEGNYTVSGCTTKKEVAAAIQKGLEKGHLTFTLDGKKLEGTFQLIRLKQDPKKEQPEWLLFKSADSFASTEEVTAKEESVKTGRSLAEIAGQKKQKKTDSALPGFIKPMLATLVGHSFTDPEWLFEIKWDGYRTLAYIDTSVHLYSRNQNLLDPLFPLIVEDLRKPSAQAVLDGEIVVLDKNGHSNFQLLQNYLNSPEKGAALVYYVFDLLFLNSTDLRALPLTERKKQLSDLCQTSSFSLVRYSDHVLEKGEAFFQQVVKHQLEGVIAKHVNSPYRSGRTKEWLKIKVKQRQEVVIGGFTEPKGSRKNFGSLLVGLYDQEGQFTYAGHVGTGFNDTTLKSLYEQMQPLLQQHSSFASLPSLREKIFWVKPQIACQVQFSEWTEEGIMRQPVFKGLCIDKKASKIKKESSPSSSTFPTSNPDKILYPDLKYTKRDVMHYYEQVAPYILPYLKDRPIVMHRYPNGIEGEKFFQKNVADLHVPAFMKTVDIEHENRIVTYFVIQNLESLEYIVNLGCLEMHVFHSTVAHLDLPNYFVLDLDPLDVPFSKVIIAAQAIEKHFAKMDIPHVWKTSGARGLHLYIPLGAKYEGEQVAQLGKILGLMLHKLLPRVTSLERKPEKRKGKIYLDVLQNRPRQTVIAPYSLRAKPQAPVATPLRPEELIKGMKPQDYNLSNTLARLKEVGDLFAPVLGKAFNIKKWLKNYSSI